MIETKSGFWHEGNGYTAIGDDKRPSYFVIYANTMDMLREENPLYIGQAVYRWARGNRISVNRYLNYVWYNDKYTRLYDSRRLHKFTSESKARELFPEFFI